MTHCPNCNKYLDELVVSFRSTKTLSKYTGWSSNNLEEILSYECPHCGSSLDYKSADEIVDRLITEYEKGE